MGNSRVKWVAQYYIMVLNDKGIVSKDKSEISLEIANHCCEKIIEFVDGGRIEKAHRWLGFVQGILYCEKIFTIDQMRNHNANELIMKVGD